MLADILHFSSMDDAPNRIRELRLEAGLSQQQLGEAIGVSKMTISDLERGKMRLDTEYMRRIASVLNVYAADLLPTDDNPNALSVDERRLIDQYRTATDDQRYQLQRVAEVLAPFHNAAPTAQMKPARRRRA